ncbi:hypothetical protein P22_0206 [Propionispora sp. 2/2-37]|uniref:nucleotide exchange factor GrpE n=1 Tax=Propionispora sp. 2/2-37 TaxID=1677858 RepID=UPI0006C18A49|nr:nucleotide exchange factor GrpE [Propionispora sp. 2/2-37]CUH94144.1 hypothetical protein P22_0206 [Propionispora sp. 2/2-37]
MAVLLLLIVKRLHCREFNYLGEVNEVAETMEKINQEENKFTEQTEVNEETASQNEETADLPENSELEKLRIELSEKEALLNEQSERFKRLQADFENFKRRTRQEKEELSNIMAQNIVYDILPVLDNFERALQNANTDDAAGFLSGIQMIHRQFTDVMEKIGLTPIEALGKQFDPQHHEAVMSVEDAEQLDGMILEELQKGYIVRGKVIRPSMVKVVNNS